MVSRRGLAWLDFGRRRTSSVGVAFGNQELRKPTLDVQPFKPGGVLPVGPFKGTHDCPIFFKNAPPARSVFGIALVMSACLVFAPYHAAVVRIG